MTLLRCSEGGLGKERQRTDYDNDETRILHGMKTYTLEYKDGHLFTRIDGHRLLVDTGAPQSFGTMPVLSVDSRSFEIGDAYMGLTAKKVSEYTGIRTAGLVGTDILNAFDVIFDVPDGKLILSEAPLELEGQRVAIDEFTGIPIIRVEIGGTDYRIVFRHGRPDLLFPG
jgi:hypothetical protein